MTIDTQAITPRNSRLAARSCGILLIAGSLLSIVAMAHHPTVHVQNAADVANAIAKTAPLSALVHGVLIALMFVVFFCLGELAARLGRDQPAIRGGTMAYQLGVYAMTGAALINGFVVSDIAAHGAAASQAGLDGIAPLLLLCHALNQKLATLGVVAMSIGIASWSSRLLMERGLARWLGLFGLIAGAVPVLAMALGYLRLDLHGMGAVVALQSLWNLGIGVLLMRKTAPTS